MQLHILSCRFPFSHIVLILYRVLAVQSRQKFYSFQNLQKISPGGLRAQRITSHFSFCVKRCESTRRKISHTHHDVFNINQVLTSNLTLNCINCINCSEFLQLSRFISLLLQFRRFGTYFGVKANRASREPSARIWLNLG